MTSELERFITVLITFGASTIAVVVTMFLIFYGAMPKRRRR